ncbi:SDR family oxidoreductase [Neptunicella marina]|uniref:SDR family oxidoreductase n=1 Tax=Neptunicella marina TaxID=2125989 RepID=A0A8J6IUD9_9ALTE|nr:SDR family oxidoreductase [Neptunicella marina]MBC3765813.1 SDR family oxidoreductase [Neptunicella marina]
MIAITGATGQLGRLVIEQLLQATAANQLIALVRDPAKAVDLQEKGVQVRQADYSQPHTLDAALSGVDKLLLISGSEVGQRVSQHRNIINAAKNAGVQFIAYTSLLHAQQSIMGLADEHRQTEDMLQQSGIAHVLLRNGWYSENYTAAIPSALQFNALLGSAGAGKIASAARADYAAAAAAVMLTEGHAGKVYELAGDTAYTLAEFATELSKQTGKTIAYNDLPEAEYKKILLEAGLPEGLADLLASSDASAAKGALFDDSHQLSQLIGRESESLATSIQRALGEVNAAH